MKILKPPYQLNTQKSLLECPLQRPLPSTALILCITALALLTGCTIELKPDKVPGGITGNDRPAPIYPTHASPTPVYPGPMYPGPLTSMNGDYGLGTQPINNQSSNRSTGDGFTIKITSR
jgi:hypothetical protein